MTSIPNQPVKRIWKYFIPAWLFPIVLIGAAFADDLGHLPEFIIPLIGLSFVGAFLCYCIPYMCRRLSYHDATLYGMIVPFGIWIVAVAIRGIFTLK
jgi:hypothetical protein